MDDAGQLILKNVEKAILSKPRLGLAQSLQEWSREWLQAYYQIISGVDPNAPADADQVEDMAGQKEKHDAIMDLVPFSDVQGLAALLQDAEGIGMPSLHAGKRPESPPPPPPPPVQAQQAQQAQAPPPPQ